MGQFPRLKWDDAQNETNPLCLTPVPRPMNYEYCLKKELFNSRKWSIQVLSRFIFIQPGEPVWYWTNQDAAQGYFKPQWHLESDGSFGPIFGVGQNLLISNEPNANSDSTTKLGHTYRCPDDANASFLAGLSDFVVMNQKCSCFSPKVPFA